MEPDYSAHFEKGKKLAQILVEKFLSMDPTTTVTWQNCIKTTEWPGSDYSFLIAIIELGKISLFGADKFWVKVASSSDIKIEMENTGADWDMGALQYYGKWVPTKHAMDPDMIKVVDFFNQNVRLK